MALKVDTVYLTTKSTTLTSKVSSMKDSLNSISNNINKLKNEDILVGQIADSIYSSYSTPINLSIQTLENMGNACFSLINISDDYVEADNKIKNNIN